MVSPVSGFFWNIDDGGVNAVEEPHSDRVFFYASKRLKVLAETRK